MTRSGVCGQHRLLSKKRWSRASGRWLSTRSSRPPSTNKGDALHEPKRFEEALVAYNQTLALDPQYSGAWNGKAIALRALGHVAKARRQTGGRRS